ncbi:trypsin-like peptidase domain-containing protein [Flavicella sp.]|uniref:trypsin-like peptidase domain-containing protein n=1 Tax=Flavicella sp. TaxID=2957742 RepID=UPI00301682C1
MKKIASLVFVAFLGGAISLVGFSYMMNNQRIDNNESISAVSNGFVSVPAHYSSLPNIAGEKTDFVDAASMSLDAVVHVKNTSMSTYYDPFSDFFYGRRNGQTRQREQVGTGSGVLISPDGYIVTNNHVIDNASSIEVTLNNRKVYQAELIGTDPSSDIALLKIEGEGFESIPFANSDAIEVGEWVLAIGNPYNLTSTVTAGIISAKGRDLGGNSSTESFIQTDAAVNPGNSGGALVNTRGELIGINTAISSQTGSFVGYSFAVPSNIAKKVIEDIMEFGNVQKALIGIQYDPRKDDLEGVMITSVTKGGGAKKAGLLEEDIIVKIENVKIRKFSDLKGQLSAKRPGDKIQVTVLRGETYITKTVELTEYKTLKINVLGFSVEKLTKEELKKYKIKSGVKIVNIKNSELQELGVSEGDVLVEINNEKVSSVDQVDKLLKEKSLMGYFKMGVLNSKGVKENYIFK